MWKTRELLAPQLTNRNQSWNFSSQHQLFETQSSNASTKTLRVRIRRNAYDEQSFAEVSLLDRETGAWNVLHSIDIKDCHCVGVSYVKKATIEEFLADEKRLLNAAVALLTN